MNFLKLFLKKIRGLLGRECLLELRPKRSYSKLRIRFPKSEDFLEGFFLYTWRLCNSLLLYSTWHASWQKRHLLLNESNLIEVVTKRVVSSKEIYLCPYVLFVYIKYCSYITLTFHWLVAVIKSYIQKNSSISQT